LKSILSQLEAIHDRAAAPVLILAAIINVSCFLVSLRVPIREFDYALAVALTVCVLAVIAVDHSATAASVCAAIGLSLAVRWLLATTVWRACAGGLGALSFPDCWSYSVFARYLWYNPRGAQGGLTLADQWASHLSGTRFASASLLDFLSVFVRPGDPAAGMLLFFGICCVALFFSVLFLSSRLGLSSMAGWIAAGLSLATGWYVDAVLVANFDNIIFLALFTTLLGFLLGTKGDMRWTRFDFVAMALLVPACSYTYPEGMALGAVLALPLLGSCLMQVLAERRVAIRAALLALVSIAIASPYIRIGVVYLRNQLVAAPTIQPGTGNFEGLLTRRFLPAAFALGEEYPASSLSLVHLLLALVLLGLIIVGSRRIYRLSPAFACVPIPLLALSLWQGVLAQYAYGLFKVSFLAVWWFAPVMAVGIECAADELLLRWRSFAKAGLAVSVVALVWICRMRDLWHMPSMGAPCISAASDLKALKRTALRAPVVLAPDDDFEYLWAAYYLRDADVLTPSPRGYFAMPHVLSLLASVRKPLGDRPPLKLVSGRRAAAIWSNGTFSLVSDDSPEILQVRSPNGLEVLGDGRFFWLGNQPATLVISARRAGAELLMAKEFIFGPSAPGLPFRNLVTECGQHRIESTFSRDSEGIPIQLDGGTQECRIWCTNPPSIPRQPNGDTRVLLLGLKEYRIVDIADDGRQGSSGGPIR